MEPFSNFPHATPETVWAALQNLTKERAEINQMIKETDRMIKETGQQMKDTDRRMKELQKTVGGWSNSHGSFAEEYFFNAFKNGKQNFFGEEFDRATSQQQSFSRKLDAEYDIVLYNHSAIALIEVKYKAHKNDVEEVLKKAQTYRMLHPQYDNFRIYLGLASLSFYPELEQECIAEGIAVIKQVGDTVVINDENLKVF